MGRRPCCCKEEKLNRGSWTAMEDKVLTDYITLHGEGKWRDLPKKAGLMRCGKSCRLRWLNYLRPDIKRGNISQDEEDLIVRLHKLLGNRWSLIAGRLPGRTDNEIKNYWNTNIGKKNAQTSLRRTSSTPNLKSSNQDKDIKRNVASPTNAQSFVIKTKATRCTKVIIPPYDPQCNDQLNTNKPLGPIVEPSSDKLIEQKDDDHMMNQSQPSDFMKSLEMDDCFLSDLLNTDISLFRGFDGDDQLQGHHCNDINTSDPTTLLSEVDDHNLHDQDFQAMASFLDSELNWFLN